MCFTLLALYKKLFFIYTFAIQHLRGNYYTLQALQGNHGSKVYVILLQKDLCQEMSPNVTSENTKLAVFLAVLCKHLLNDTYQP